MRPHPGLSRQYPVHEKCCSGLDAAPALWPRKWEARACGQCTVVHHWARQGLLCAAAALCSSGCATRGSPVSDCISSTLRRIARRCTCSEGRARLVLDAGARRAAVSRRGTAVLRCMAARAIRAAVRRAERGMHGTPAQGKRCGGLYWGDTQERSRGNGAVEPWLGTSGDLL